MPSVDDCPIVKSPNVNIEKAELKIFRAQSNAIVHMLKIQSCGGLNTSQSDSGFGIEKSDVGKPLTEVESAPAIAESGILCRFLRAAGRRG